MYQPECFGNETNIVNCRYNTTNTLGGCSSSSYDTSVICLPGMRTFFKELLKTDASSAFVI